MKKNLLLTAILVLVGFLTVKTMQERSMQSLLQISVGDDAPEVVNGIIEIPRGSLNKYEYNTEHRVMELDRVLGGSVPYPVDYGFIPRTLMVDGDPLDIILISTEPFPSGVLVEARTVGLMKMEDGDDPDEKIFAVAKSDPRMKDIEDISDVPQQKIDEISTFFSTYKNAEGKTTKVTGWGDRKEAKKVIEKAMAEFQ